MQEGDADSWCQMRIEFRVETGLSYSLLECVTFNPW